ncbi:MAG: hypothetical protein GY940_23140, partial [bacterium]|nr:hypothetical protein [bacterium]
LVPLPDNPEITVEYQELIGYELEGEPEMLIGKLRKKYSVSQLLEGIEKKEERIRQRFKEESGSPVPTPGTPSAGPIPVRIEPEKKKWYQILWITLTVIGGLLGIITALVTLL